MILYLLIKKGRPAYPWSSRFYGCGVEPVCSAFDMGNHTSTSFNKLNELGVKTSTKFQKGVHWKTKYSINVNNLKE